MDLRPHRSSHPRRHLEKPHHIIKVTISLANHLTATLAKDSHWSNSDVSVNRKGQKYRQLDKTLKNSEVCLLYFFPLHSL